MFVIDIWLYSNVRTVTEIRPGSLYHSSISTSGHRDVPYLKVLLFLR